MSSVRLLSNRIIVLVDSFQGQHHQRSLNSHDGQKNTITIFQLRRPPHTGTGFEDVFFPCKTSLIFSPICPLLARMNIAFCASDLIRMSLPTVNAYEKVSFLPNQSEYTGKIKTSFRILYRFVYALVNGQP